MPNFRGPGIPFISKQPWLLSSPKQDGPPYIPNFPTGPLEQLSRTPRAARAAKGFRTPPVIAAAASAFLPAPIAVALAAQRQLPAGKSRAQAPLLFYTPPRFRTQLAARPWWLKTATKVRPPVVLDYFQAKPRVKLAYWRPPPAGKSTLRPPTIIGAAAAPFQPKPPRVALTQAYRQTRVEYTLRKPTVIGPAATAATIPPPRIRLAAPFQVAIGFVDRWSPAIINPPPAATIPLRITLAPPPQRKAKAAFRGPVVVGPFATTTLQQRTPRVRLAQRQWQVRPTRSTIRPPIVVNPFVAPTVTVQAGTDWAASIASFY